MVRNKNEGTADSVVKTETGHNTGHREQQSRSRTNSRGRYRGRQQNTARNENSGRDAQNTSAAGQAHSQGTQKGPRNYDGYGRDNSRQKGYHRDKGKNYGRYAHTGKSREEETIDDIKRDILRIEKEIELEIKEIRSMKFL
jgi:hypothetical protein